MRVEQMLRDHGDHEWGCQLSNVILRRGDRKRAFELTVPGLTLLADKNGSNKLPLMGRTGSGKSTLLNLISAMDLPQEGTITWKFPDGKTFHWGQSGLKSADAKRLRIKYIGFAFQDSTLIPHLNVIDNLSYPLQLKRISKYESLDTAAACLKEVLIEDEKVSDLSQRYPSQLSGGQRQRIALAQSMIHDPSVLFADEPTGSLDSITRKQVMTVIHKWVNNESGKRALLWVTHHDSDPAEAGLSHRLLVEGGKCKRDPVLHLVEDLAS